MTDIQTFVTEKIRKAGDIALTYFNQKLTMTEKGHPADFVTEGDVAVNEFLVREITHTFPTHSIVSEELENVVGDSEYTWYIDPIDGTFNYGHRLPLWAVMISIRKNDVPYFSAVFFPVHGDLYTADETHSYLNGEKIEAQNKTSLAGVSGLGIRMPEARVSLAKGDNFVRFNRAISQLNQETDAIVGGYHCACVSVGIATGAFSFLMINAGYAWDWYPVAHICENAGAVVTNSYGKPYDASVHDIVISLPGIQHELLRLFEV